MLFRLFRILLLIFLPGILAAQNVSINLSPKHANKLNTYKSGHKRLVKYYKFYKKDSTRFMKKQERHYKKTLDSAYRAERKDEKFRAKMAKRGIVLPDKRLATADTTEQQLKAWYAVMKDSTSSDSLKTVARQKVKELSVQKAKQHPGFQNLMEKYQLTGDTADWKLLTQQVPGLDTLSGVFDASPGEVFALAEKQAEQRLHQVMGVGALGGELAQAQQLQNLPAQYKKQYEQYLDKDHWKDEGKEKAVKEAVDYFAEHGDKLQHAQAGVSKLLSKYREFSNSNDLSTAVKRTSMKGKAFKERWLIGGNFNVVSTDPVSLDFSPMLGYKFTTRFSVGLGMNYRHTFSDSIRNSWYISPRNTSYKAFASYDVIKAFFAFAEWEKSGIRLSSNDKTRKTWKDNYFIGVGKKFLVHPKVYLTLTALYNLNSEDQNPVHPRRFQIRTGFQLSELATRKRKVYYDPNR
jgi:hypothetical protein